MKTIRNLVVLPALAAVLAFSAHAETLVEYNFDTNLAPSASLSGLQAGDVAWGSFNGVAQNTSGSYFRSGGSGYGNSGNLAIRRRATSAVSGEPAILATSEAAAISTGSYVEFTVNPDLGNLLSLSSLGVWVAAQQLSSADAFTASFFLRSSLDNYASTLATKTVASTTASQPSGDTLSFDFGDSAYQSIGASVTFRVYVYAESGGAYAVSNQLARIDQITLTGGLAPIPEPAGVAALASGVVLCLAFFRRRSARKSS